MTEPMHEFRMPSLGADMAAGRLLQWLKAPGDQVKRGDIIAEVDTDKGVIEIEVFTDGTVSKLLVQEGARVPVGTVLALIAGPGAAAEEAPAPSPPEAGRPIRATPVAKRFAAERGIDLAGVKGTGPDGAITLADLEGLTPPASAAGSSEEEAAGGRLRRAIAAAMSRSKREIPHYYLSTTIDLGPVVGWLADRNRERPPAERLLLGVVQLKAVALALREFPDLNAWWVGDRLVLKDGIHVGMAVALHGGGVVAPAIRGTDRLALDELMRAVRSLVDRARAGRLRSSELADATFTVTSLGERGVDAVVGVIQPPQVALVGFGRPVQRPWVVGGQIAPRPVVTASLSGDHRASDGHRGALFLARVEEMLQEPGKL